MAPTTSFKKSRPTRDILPRRDKTAGRFRITKMVAPAKTAWKKVKEILRRTSRMTRSQSVDHDEDVIMTEDEDEVMTGTDEERSQCSSKSTTYRRRTKAEQVAAACNSMLAATKRQRRTKRRTEQAKEEEYAKQWRQALRESRDEPLVVLDIDYQDPSPQGLVAANESSNESEKRLQELQRRLDQAIADAARHQEEHAKALQVIRERDGTIAKLGQEHATATSKQQATLVDREQFVATLYGEQTAAAAKQHEQVVADIKCKATAALNRQAEELRAVRAEVASMTASNEQNIANVRQQMGQRIDQLTKEHDDARTQASSEHSAALDQKDKDCAARLQQQEKEHLDALSKIKEEHKVAVEVLERKVTVLNQEMVITEAMSGVTRGLSAAAIPDERPDAVRINQLEKQLQAQMELAKHYQKMARSDRIKTLNQKLAARDEQIAIQIGEIARLQAELAVSNAQIEAQAQASVAPPRGPEVLPSGCATDEVMTGTSQPPDCGRRVTSFEGGVEDLPDYEDEDEVPALRAEIEELKKKVERVESELCQSQTQVHLLKEKYAVEDTTAHDELVWKRNRGADLDSDDEEAAHDHRLPDHKRKKPCLGAKFERRSREPRPGPSAEVRAAVAASRAQGNDAASALKGLTVAPLVCQPESSRASKRKRTVPGLDKEPELPSAFRTGLAVGTAKDMTNSDELSALLEAGWVREPTVQAPAAQPAPTVDETPSIVDGMSEKKRGKRPAV